MPVYYELYKVNMDLTGIRVVSIIHYLQ